MCCADPSFFYSILEGVNVSQEWDEVANEVKLMITRLGKFRDDLLKAADGGGLTDKQREFARDSTVLTSGCSLSLLELYAEAMAEKTEEG